MVLRTNPNHVVTSASEIPLAMVLGSPVPNKVRLEGINHSNDRTNKPKSGATAAINFTTQM